MKSAPGGQRIVETDDKRNIATTTRYNALDQPIYRQVKDAAYGVLSEEFMAYDADGRLAWSRRTGPSGVNYDTTTKYDPLGRAVSTKTTGNNANAYEDRAGSNTVGFQPGAAVHLRERHRMLSKPAGGGGGK